MRIIAISDLHGDLIDLKDLPEGDVLVIAGDVLPDDFHPPGRDQVGTSRIDRQGWFHDDVLVPWLRHLKTRFPSIILVPGNHDFFYQAVMISGVAKTLPEGVTYLSETTVEVGGVKFFGAGWNLTTGWAFALLEEKIEEKCGEIPLDTDVLIVHGPPFNKEYPPLHHYTSSALAKYLTLNRGIKVVITGHVHEAYGVYPVASIPGHPIVYVVSVKDRNYRTVHPPTVIDIEVPKNDP